MLRRFFATIGRIGVYLVPFMIGGFFVFYLLFSNFAALNPGSKEQAFFEIKEGWDLKTISKELEKQGIIKAWWALYYLHNFKKKDNQAPLKITAGEYSLSAGMKPSEIFEELLKGELVKHEIIIPPGATIDEIARIIGESTLTTKEEAEKALKNQNLMRRLSIPAYIPEGYILPGTYEFSRPTDAAKIVFKLTSEGRDRLDKEHKNWKARGEKLGFHPYEVITLASIIEKETKIPEERARISSVFHNRYRIQMPLKSAAALRYGDPEIPKDQEPTEEQKNLPGPYNTYLNTGLPSTPICSPSRESIDAALSPEDTDYLYFLKMSDGSHAFATTYHNYQKLLEQHPVGGSGADDSSPEVSEADLANILGE